MDAIRARIRDVPDFPKKGIVFKDITPVLSDGKLFRQVIDTFAARWKDERIDKVIGIELGMGAAACAVLGADLSHEYVTENADYRS